MEAPAFISQFMAFFEGTVSRPCLDKLSWGHPQMDIRFVKWQIECKVRNLASRQRNKMRGGKGWSACSFDEVYGKFGLKRINRLPKYRVESPVRALT